MQPNNQVGASSSYEAPRVKGQTKFARETKSSALFLLVNVSHDTFGW